MRSCWIRIGPKYSKTGVLIRGEDAERATDTRREERHMATEAEIEQCRGRSRMPRIAGLHQKLGEMRGNLRGSMALLKP